MENKMVKKEQVLPDYIKNESIGVENISTQDVLTPRLKLIQASSIERRELNIPEGHFLNSISKEDYGNKVTFIPILTTSGYLIFEGEGIDAKVIARKFKGDIIPPLNEEMITKEKISWHIDAKGNNVKPEAILTYVYIGLVNERDLVSWSLSSSAIKVAKQFNSLLLLKNCPIYAQTFQITSKLTKGSGGEFYIPQISPAGFVEKELYLKLEEQYNKLKTKRFVYEEQMNEVETKDENF